MKVAIPRFADNVAPCFEHSATITIFRIEGGQLVEQMDFNVQSRETLDRVRLLKDQEVDTLICGGVQDAFENLLLAAGIEVISWMRGNTDSLLTSFIRGELEPGSGRPGYKTDKSVIENIESSRSSEKNHG
jgi:predicted Fe-Mo cluster-binding NifX family protein